MSSQAAEWKDGPAKLLPALEGRKGRAVELAHRADQGVDAHGRDAAVAGADGHLPLLSGLVEASLGHLAAEADALAQAEILGGALQVGQQVGLRREAGGPLVGLREGEAVQLIRHIDAAARVDVLEPGAADVAVLLEQRHCDAGLAQAVRRRQARRTGTDHGAPEATVTADVGRVPRRFPWIAAGKREFLGQEPVPVCGGLRSDQETEHAPALLRRQPMVGPARGQVLGQRSEGQRTRLGLFGSIEATPGHEQLCLVRLERFPQQRQVAGPMRHRA